MLHGARATPNVSRGVLCERTNMQYRYPDECCLKCRLQILRPTFSPRASITHQGFIHSSIHSSRIQSLFYSRTKDSFTPRFTHRSPAHQPSAIKTELAHQPRPLLVDGLEPLQQAEVVRVGLQRVHDGLSGSVAFIALHCRCSSALHQI